MVNLVLEDGSFLNFEEQNGPCSSNDRAENSDVGLPERRRLQLGLGKGSMEHRYRLFVGIVSGEAKLTWYKELEALVALTFTLLQYLPESCIRPHFHFLCKVAKLCVRRRAMASVPKKQPWPLFFRLLCFRLHNLFFEALL